MVNMFLQSARCVAVGVLLTLAGVGSVQSANILFYHGAACSYSHQAGMVPLVEALVAKGHNVTHSSPYAYYGRSRVNEFVPAITRRDHDNLVKEFSDGDIWKRIQSKSKSSSFRLLDIFGDFAERLASSKEVTDWIRDNKFDLVVIDTVGNEVIHAAAEYWKAGVISYSSGSFLFPWEHSLYNIPDETSWLPQFDSRVVERYGFVDRLSTLFWTGANMWVYNNVYLPRVEALVEKMGLNLLPGQSISKLIKERTQLLFVNFDVWNQFARPLPPFVMSVSGMTFNWGRKPEALPEDIEKWLENGDGREFIYISFGTAAKISAVPKKVADMFLNALGKIRVKFLLKWEGEAPPVPKNVFVRKWFPQLDVLGHPNIKGFMTQGGQNSLQEAICSGVAMILIPVFGDQDITGKFVSERELGKLMEFSNFTEESLMDNIEEILRNDKYATNVKKMREVSRQMSSESLKRAISWTERILRGDDLSHLKPPSVQQPWWMYRSLDTFAVLFLILYLVSTGFAYVGFKVLERLFRSSLRRRKKVGIKLGNKLKVK